MNLSFKKKNVFISGATHGIGLDCLLNFAKLGANVITFSRDQKKINNLKKKLNKTTSKYLIKQGDILDDDFIHNFSKEVLNKYKKIDILIHNVGGGGRWGKDNFLKTKLNVWDEVYKKNNSGLIIFTKYFLPTMIKNNWGRVIAIGSVCGIESRVEDRSWFTAAKSAQHGIIKSFSKKHQFTKKNITFNSISPGPIFIKNTGWEFEKRKNPKKFKKKIENLIPTKHIGKPEDISPLCLFLSSDHAKYINGSNFIIDGGTSNAI
ncbi:SDR family NAD(P)-dependent oxidoreductase [Candidatus Pelagibacter communis]|uniref:SDR family NAD(P)-dependent oxidoreductase n=1 Tax=Pelagibacter ubique TaxID=198252 RepID=UPI00094D0B1A|nr:SDR family oxidoreductase [Candidatus Pelagibacter ubique]